MRTKSGFALIRGTKSVPSILVCQDAGGGLLDFRIWIYRVFPLLLLLFDWIAMLCVRFWHVLVCVCVSPDDVSTMFQLN